MKTLFINFKLVALNLFLVFVFSILFSFSYFYHGQANAAEEKIENHTSIKIDKSSSSSLQLITTPIIVKTVVNPLTFTDRSGNVYRLASLESPVISSSRVDKDFAELSMRLAKETLEGKELLLYQFKGKNAPKVNRYNQQLVHAIVKSDEKWVQADYLTQGIARVETSPLGENEDLSNRLKAFEQSAYKNKLGLWSLPDFEIFNAHKPDDIKEGFQIVQGTLKKVSLHKNTLYLNFGNSWKTDFSAAMDTKTRKTFSKNGLNPMNWANKTIEIRGFVRHYNGPFMGITHAGQIRLIDNENKTLNEP